ncbi:uncharacterized protein LOC135806684 isoform X1 [Sycon ciliatum]|uniref:uncharacterized protein LOC135806684 isoform X1 n=1 Tax=Sycon ciliatum TaxID=27933 RepID=UPI0031F72079
MSNNLDCGSCCSRKPAMERRHTMFYGRSLGLVILLWMAITNVRSCPSICVCHGSTTDCADKALSAVPRNVSSNSTYLKLYDNQFDILQRSTFVGLEFLVGIDLNWNRIHTIEYDAFHGLPILTSIWLRGNRIVSIPPGTFDLPGLLSPGVHIDLRKNQLRLNGSICSIQEHLSLGSVVVDSTVTVYSTNYLLTTTVSVISIQKRSIEVTVSTTIKLNGSDYCVEYRRTHVSGVISTTNLVTTCSASVSGNMSLVGLEEDATYSIQAYVMNSSQVLQYCKSPIYNLTTLVATPSRAPNITHLYPSAQEINISWTAISLLDFNDRSQGYMVSYRADHSINVSTVHSELTSITINGLTAGTVYTLSIAATSSAGVGPSTSITTSTVQERPITMTTMEECMSMVVTTVSSQQVPSTAGPTLQPSTVLTDTSIAAIIACAASIILVLLAILIVLVRRRTGVPAVAGNASSSRTSCSQQTHVEISADNNMYDEHQMVSTDTILTENAAYGEHVHPDPMYDDVH